jgi:hypothetical protein
VWVWSLGETLLHFHSLHYLLENDKRRQAEDTSGIFNMLSDLHRQIQAHERLPIDKRFRGGNLAGLSDISRLAVVDQSFLVASTNGWGSSNVMVELKRANRHP